jgi:hypothetical protein
MCVRTSFKLCRRETKRIAKLCLEFLLPSWCILKYIFEKNTDCQKSWKVVKFRSQQTRPEYFSIQFKEIFFVRFKTHVRGCGLLQFSNTTFLVSLVLSLTVPVKFRSCISVRFYLRAQLSFCTYCTENPIYVCSEKELRGLNPNSYIHVSVSDFPG